MFEQANTTHYRLTIEGIDNNKLQVLAFDGIEAIDAEYAFEITLVNKFVRFDATQLLSKPAYLSFTGDNKQGIHGVIQSVKRASVGKDYAVFKVILTPRFSHLYKRFNQRAFVGKTVPQIITTILNEYGMQQGDKNGFDYKFKDPAQYTAREFCTQYEETDAAFIHRLCEEEGVAMHYEFTPNSHQLVFTDAQPFFPSIESTLEYMSDTGFVADYPVLKRFDVNLSSAPLQASFRNYNFTNMKIPEGSAQGTKDKKAGNSQEPELENYNYPNPHLNKGKGDQLAKIEIERNRAQHILAEANGDIPSLHAGYFFTVDGYASLDTLDTKEPWLINQIRHQGRQPQVLEEFGGADSAQSTTPQQTTQQLQKYFRQPIAEELQLPSQELSQGYRNALIATPQAVVYRPKRHHPKPQVLGSQTAIVTGAAGEEIYCDEYGRIKIQFHWDREGSYDENSSHWIRVASNWAHDGYGAVVIPRVGMEVMVDFLEGDPDNPIIKGALHNGINKVPYDLPANKTRSVFKTSSSKGGVGSNELRIEDKAGQEQIFVQSQKDFDQLTKNNHTVQVKNNSHLQVQNEHSETIVKNRYTKNESEEHHLTALDRKTQIMMNDYKEVAMSEHKTIGTVMTTEAGMEIHLKSGMQTVVDGGLSLTLKAGGQHIILNPMGIWMTQPQWTGGVPMVGTPAAPLSPIGKIKTVAATLSPVQVATFKKNAPFCLECMLSSMGICTTDFSNKTTPDGVLDRSKLPTSSNNPMTTGIVGGGFAGDLNPTTSAIPDIGSLGANQLTGSLPDINNMSLDNLGNLTNISSQLMTDTPFVDGLQQAQTIYNQANQAKQMIDNPMGVISSQADSLLAETPLNEMGLNSNSLQTITNNPEQALNDIATQNIAKHLPTDTLESTKPDLLKTTTTSSTVTNKTNSSPNPTDFITGINGKGGNNV